EFGDFAVALVLAHEWGHAVQARGSIGGLGIMLELQADCFAGAWAGHVSAGESDLLALQPGDLDEAMAGYLLFRDPPGPSPGEPDAHGSAFDRVNAFQDGFFGGATACATYPDGDFVVVDIPLTQEDLATGGDLPFAETAPLLAATLETFWSAVYPELFGTEYTPMTDYGPYLPSTGVLPPCEGIEPDDYANNAFYCPEGDYVAWDNENLFPSLWQEIGDLAVGMVLAHEWAVGAQVRAGLPIDGPAASLQADCFAGTWTTAMVTGIPILLPDETETTIYLSAGDLDEAVAGFIAFGDRPGESVTGTAFERFDAFKDGFLGGAEQCLGYSG
ncbi:MAG: neutral zinc metallopeptidase, partial [Acidimicrobiia bacterium]|nr:neutral zinc metallopeptidase [Acidimicrobiia bacterium]